MTGRHTCPVCGDARGWRAISRTSFARIIRCDACGVVRVWPPRSREALAILHDSASYVRHPYFEARRSASATLHRDRNRALLQRLFGDRPPRGGRLLDVGCDTGALLTQARDEFGCEVEGIEVARESVARARAAGLTVHLGTLDAQELPADRFDFVTMIDVIEHVASPDAVVAAVTRLLKPGGRFGVVTPNHDALLFGLARWGGWLPGIGMTAREKLYIPYHETYFNRSSLAALCSRFGLRTVAHDTYEFPLDEFGHGAGWSAVVRPVFALQAMIGRQSLQWLLAEKPAAGIQA